MLWYDHSLERRVSAQIHLIETATRAAGHGWRFLDLAPLFGRWVVGHRHFKRLLARPAELATLLHTFETIAAEARQTTSADVLALSGIGSLFGLASVSRIVETTAPEVAGRLLVAFPGRFERGAYSLLDARESWNYHAAPIPPQSYL